MLSKQYDECGNLIFGFDEYPAGIETRDYRILSRTTEQMHRLRRGFIEDYKFYNYKGAPGNILIQYWARQGDLAPIIQTQKDYDDMKNRGIVPKGYSIHHFLPLALGGNNNPDNLYLCQDNVHKWLHRRFYDRVMSEVSRAVLQNPQCNLFISLPVVDTHLLTEQNIEIYFGAYDRRPDKIMAATRTARDSHSDKQKERE